MEIIKKTSIFDHLLFLISAAIIAAIIISAKKFDWITIVGYLMALFYLLVSAGFRGALRAANDHIKDLEKTIEEYIDSQDKNK